MSKKSASGPARAPRRPAVLYVGVALLVGTLLLLAGRALFRQDKPSASTPEPSGPATAFREDGALTFFDAQGGRIASIRVEIAETEAARTQGLMGRTVMAEDQGMLFVFDAPEPRSFWMVNTPLPLDIIFVDAAKRVLNVAENTVPYSEESLPSTGPAQYVVEVNGGFCGRHGIGAGTRVDWLRH